jgi:hypothetical protein
MNIPFEDLKSEFRDEFQVLRNKIFKDSFCKKIKGKKSNGFSLAVFLEEWVNAINEGGIPNISTMYIS